MKSWYLVAGCVLVLPAIAQQPAAQLVASPTASRISSLEELDRALKDLRAVPWKIVETAPKALPVEPDGRVLEDDVSDYVLTEASLKAINEERDRIAAQGGSAISEAEAKPIIDMMDKEMCRAATVARYWEQRRLRSTHAALVEHVIEFVNEPDRADARRRLDAVDKRGDAQRGTLAASVGKCGGMAAFFDSMLKGDTPSDALVKEYDDLRASLLSTGGTAQRVAAGIPVTRRTTECPAPAPARAGNATAARRSAPDVAAYYPNEAKMDLIGGMVRVRLHYDNTGCVIDATVVESSGSTQLDMAAVRFGLDTALMPAVVDGVPQADYVTMPLKFSLMH
jgi:TonB family protein